VSRPDVLVADEGGQGVSAPGVERADLRGSLPLVLAAFAMSFVLVGGGIDTVGIFINAIVQSTDWTRSALSLGVAVGAITAALAAPAIGAAVDRYGVRVPMLAGAGLLAVGFGALVAMRAPWHFVAANVFLGAGFAAAGLLPLTIAISVRVRERTALALGIAATGSSAGALLLAPLLQAIVESLGWRGGYVVLGAAVVLTPLAFLPFALPRGPLQRAAAARPALSLRAELRRPGTPGLLALIVLPGLTTFAVSVHLVPYLTGLGHPGATAALALGGCIGIAAAGKLGGGAFADRVGPLAALRVALALGTASFALLPAADAGAALVGFVALYGLALGALAAVTPALARDVLGAERFGVLFGVLQLLGMLTAAIGPVAAGIVFDATGRYTAAIALWGAAMAAALAVALAMRVPAREPPPA
jgi:MFS family permease